MKEKIKEVQNYFKNKLLKGEFEIEKIQTAIYLKVDGYTFAFFIYHKEKDAHQYESDSFMPIPLNESDQKAIYTQINKASRELILSEKKAELEEAQKEYELLLNQLK